MKNKIFLCSTILIFCFLQKSNFAQIPYCIWANGSGDSDCERPESVATDNSGNVFITGLFNSPTLTFGTTTLVNSSPGFSDIFLTKYDSNGNVLWAKSAGGTSNDIAYSLATDNFGNTYISGYFGSPSITFGNFTLTNISLSYTDIFFVKYDANGNVIWAKQIEGLLNETAYSIAVDHDKNVYLTGWFLSPEIYCDSLTLTNSNNGYEVFLAKFDSDGNIIWAKDFGGTGNEKGISVKVDANKNVYLSGWFTSTTLNIDTITLIHSSSVWQEIFLAKFDSYGNALWAKSAGQSEEADAPESIIVDDYENVYMTGYFNSMITFDSITRSCPGGGISDDIFLTKFDANGDVNWVKCGCGTGNDRAHSISTDNSGNLYIAGNSSSSSYLTFGNTTLQTNNIFLANFDTSGNIIWLKGFDGNEYPSVALNDSGYIYLTGDFFSSITFDTITLTYPIGSAWNVFLAKFGNDVVTSINDSFNSNLFSIFPNPASDNINITYRYKAEIDIVNINNQTIMTFHHMTGTSHIEIAEIPSGVYIIRTKTNKEIVTSKFIKQ